MCTHHKKKSRERFPSLILVRSPCVVLLSPAAERGQPINTCTDCIVSFPQVKAEDYVNKSGSLTSRHRLIVELFYKFITYIAIGFTIVYTGPLAFRLIGIERPTFYTEV